MNLFFVDQMSQRIPELMQWLTEEHNNLFFMIPDELKYEGYRTDRHPYTGQTPLMIFVQTYPNKCITNELTYPGWETDTDDLGRTVLDYIIDRYGNDYNLYIPKNLIKANLDLGINI